MYKSEITTSIDDVIFSGTTLNCGTLTSVNTFEFSVNQDESILSVKRNIVETFSNNECSTITSESIQRYTKTLMPLDLNDYCNN